MYMYQRWCIQRYTEGNIKWDWGNSQKEGSCAATQSCCHSLNLTESNIIPSHLFCPGPFWPAQLGEIATNQVHQARQLVCQGDRSTLVTASSLQIHRCKMKAVVFTHFRTPEQLPNEAARPIDFWWYSSNLPDLTQNVTSSRRSVRSNKINKINQTKFIKMRDFETVCAVRFMCCPLRVFVAVFAAFPRTPLNRSSNLLGPIDVVDANHHLVIVTTSGWHVGTCRDQVHQLHSTSLCSISQACPGHSKTHFVPQPRQQFTQIQANLGSGAKLK